MKNFFENTNVKANLLISIVVLIFGTYLLPGIIDISKHYTGSLLSSLIDYFYRCSAVISVNYFEKTAGEFFYFSMILFLLFLYYISIKSYGKLIDSAKQSLGVKEENINEDVKKEIDYQKKLSKYKILRIILSVLFGCICIIFLYSVTFIYFPVIENEKFNLSIIKIAPYVDESEIIMLKSNWVRMKSKSDYDMINERIKSIVEVNELD